MGTQTLPTSATVASGLVVKSADFLTVISALEASFVGRNTSGVATSGQSLGTALYPWGNAYLTSLIVGGTSIDVSGLAASQNRIISGAVRTTSGQPDFLAPAGSAATVTVEGAATTLTVTINGTTVEVTTDIAETGLTTAPAANNTCAINDASFTDQAASKYFGEIDAEKTIITIDTVGTEISGRVGQMIALKTGTSEIMFGWLKSATEFVNVKRGYFFDSSGNPIVRETLANNDTLTLLETGWIFITNDGTTVDVSYTTPVYGYTAPGSPAAGDYWYDLTNQTWKRYSGAAFEIINRTLLGVCVQDTSNCIGARAFDFDNSFKDLNTIDLEVFSDTVVRTLETESLINVYGTEIEIPYSRINWDNSADMETGSVAADTEYYLYLDVDGQSIISTERPYDRVGDLRGRYHPYNNWRFVGQAKTDVDSDWLSVTTVSSFDGTSKSTKLDFDNLIFKYASTTTATLTADSIKFVDDAGNSKIAYNISDTFDITTDLQPGTSEKASTWYQCHRDSAGKRVMVPDITGTADANVLNSLSATGLTFQTDLVQRWDKLYNHDDNTTGYVKAVSSETVLTCMDADGNDLDLFPDGNEDFTIHGRSPVGLGAFSGIIGAVYNDSGSDFYDFYQTGKIVIIEQVIIINGGTQTSATKIDLSTAVPVTANAVRGWYSATEASGTSAEVLLTPTLSPTFGKFGTYGFSGNDSAVDPTVRSEISGYLREVQAIYYDLISGDSVNIYITGYEL